MATREQIIQAILRVAAHPSVGVLRDLAPEMADEILAIDEPTTRASKSVETRETR